jgi:hypothetical protein
MLLIIVTCVIFGLHSTAFGSSANCHCPGHAGGRAALLLTMAQAHVALMAQIQCPRLSQCPEGRGRPPCRDTEGLVDGSKVFKFVFWSCLIKTQLHSPVGL